MNFNAFFYTLGICVIFGALTFLIADVFLRIEQYKQTEPREVIKYVDSVGRYLIDDENIKDTVIEVAKLNPKGQWAIYSAYLDGHLITQTGLWPFPEFPPMPVIVKQWEALQWATKHGIRNFQVKNLHDIDVMYCHWVDSGHKYWLLNFKAGQLYARDTFTHEPQPELPNIARAGEPGWACLWAKPGGHWQGDSLMLPTIERAAYGCALLVVLK